MPQKGWLWEGRRWDHADLLLYAETYPQSFPYTPAMLNGMLQAEERDYISPTMLAGCARATVLKNVTDYDEDLNHAWTRYRGTIAHLMLENSEQEPGAIVERRLDVLVEVDGVEVLVRGKPDLILTEQAILVDYKTVDVIKAEPKSGWIAQLSVYRWMHYVVTGQLLERAFIQQISMKAAGRLEIPLWDLEKTYDYVLGRLRKFKGVFSGEYSLDGLPPVLDFTLDAVNGEQFWLCGFTPKEGRVPWCPVHAICRARWLKGQ